MGPLKGLCRAAHWGGDQPRDATPLGEWRLHKPEPPEPGVFTADVALGVIPKFMARDVEPRVFAFLAFDRTWLASARPCGNHIEGQRVEQFGPDFLTLFLGACAH